MLSIQNIALLNKKFVPITQKIKYFICLNNKFTNYIEVLNIIVLQLCDKYIYLIVTTKINLVKLLMLNIQQNISCILLHNNRSIYFIFNFIIY